MSAFIPPTPLNVEDGNISENWRKFKKAFNIYMSATAYNKEDEERQIAILLNLIGQKARDVHDTFTYEKEGDEKKIAKVMGAFELYCIPKKNLLYARWIFKIRIQKEGETYDSFVTDCKTLIQDCEYTDQNEILRDKIILDSNDYETMDAIIKTGTLPTLDQAVKKFRVAELVRKQTQDIHGKEDINAVRSKKNANNNWKVSDKQFKKNDGENKQREERKVESDPSQRRYNRQKWPSNWTCKRCGKKHEKFKCPAMGKQCNNCKKFNHFNTMCKSSRNVSNHIQVKNDNESNVQDDDDSYYCDNIKKTNVNLITWNKTLIVENSKIAFKLDTGSDVNIISYNTFNKIKDNADKRIRLNESRIKLEAYGGTEIKQYGSVNLNVRCDNNWSIEKFIVTKNNSYQILGLSSCIKFNLIKKNVNSVQEQNAKLNISKQYKDIFQGIGCFPNEYNIEIKDNVKETSLPPYRIPIKLQEKVKYELNRLCEIGIIEKFEKPTAWASRLTVVEKSDGSLRLCLDPKYINENIKDEHYEIPSLAELKSKLGNAKYFSCLDLKEGFWQIKLSKESIKYCAFSTMFGTYAFKRLPFGLKISAQVFQKYNTQIFGDIPNVFIYIDDILIYAESQQKHNETLIRVLDRAREMNIKFNLRKFQYNKQEIKYLGHIFKDGTVKMDPDRVKAITEYDQPKNKKELQILLGLINYLRDFIPNLAELSSNLRNLLKKNIEFVWLHSHTECFNQIKKVISQAKSLQNFDRNKEITIQTDSSKNAIGCVLLQDKKPVCYASKSLSTNEIKFAQIEKEFLAILFACKRFHYYIYGQNVKVQTDHKPLIGIMKKEINKISSNRMQRIKIKLSIYKLELIYTPGNKMLIADALSRASSKAENTEVAKDLTEVVHTINVSSNILEKIKIETQNDVIFTKLVTLCKNGWPNSKTKVDEDIRFYFKYRNEIYLNNEILYLNEKIMIPKPLQKLILNKVHEAHLGIVKTKIRAKSLFYFIGMDRQIEELVGKCAICQKFRNQNSFEPMLIHEIPKLPFEIIACDIAEFSQKNYLVVADYYSHWIELKILDDKTAESVIKVLKEIFATHGVPQKLISDNMPFNSFNFKEFAKEWNFESITTSPRYPRSNGFIERYVGICKKFLKKVQEGNLDINNILMEYRNSPILGSNITPAMLLFSRRTRTKLPSSNELLKPKVITDFNSFLYKKKMNSKINHDKNTRVRNYNPQRNDYVMYRDYVKKNWKPAQIVKFDKTPRSIIIKDLQNNKTLRRNFHDINFSKHYDFHNLRRYNTNELDINIPVDNKNNYWYDYINKNSENVKPDVVNNNNNSNPSYITRSGRTVKPVEKLNL